MTFSGNPLGTSQINIYRITMVFHKSGSTQQGLRIVCAKLHEQRSVLRTSLEHSFNVRIVLNRHSNFQIYFLFFSYLEWYMGV
jgi:hypothetical protein